MREAFVVLWWVRKGHRPGSAEATSRLELLRTKRPTYEAFTFRQAFPSPDARQSGQAVAFAGECPAT